MRATIKDVSSRSGVSIKTVSRVLNNERYVGTASRVAAVGHSTSVTRGSNRMA